METNVIDGETNVITSEITTVTCAYCGKEIKENEDVFVSLSHWLQWFHYCDLPEYKRYYCSKECFADDWTVEPMKLIKPTIGD